MTDRETARLIMHAVDKAQAQRIRGKAPSAQDRWAEGYPFEGDLAAIGGFLRATDQRGWSPRGRRGHALVGQLEDFRETASAFAKAYDFFPQIIKYGDTRVEKLAIYLKLLVQLLRTEGGGVQLDLSDVVLTHYRLKKLEDAELALVPGKGDGVKGVTAAGSALARETKTGMLEDLIEQLNKLFRGDRPDGRGPGERGVVDHDPRCEQ